jgi:hypothetical protein
MDQETGLAQFANYYEVSKTGDLSQCGFDLESGVLQDLIP